MKFNLPLQILLCVVGVFFFLLCPFGWRPNDGDIVLPREAVPFPYRADDRHLYVAHADPGFMQHELFARCTVRRDHAEQFLREYGFTKGGLIPTTLAAGAFPEKIKSWWNLAKYPEVQEWQKSYPDSGFAQAFLVNDELFIRALGNYHGLALKDRALARWRSP